MAKRRQTPTTNSSSDSRDSLASRMTQLCDDLHGLEQLLTMQLTLLRATQRSANALAALVDEASSTSSTSSPTPTPPSKSRKLKKAP